MEIEINCNNCNKPLNIASVDATSGPTGKWVTVTVNSCVTCTNEAEERGREEIRNETN